jgi:hypothetical protein
LRLVDGCQLSRQLVQGDVILEVHERHGCGGQFDQECWAEGSTLQICCRGFPSRQAGTIDKAILRS